MASAVGLDDPGRVTELRAIIGRKPALRKLYEEFYSSLRATLEECPAAGMTVELGSGGGFAREVIPEIVTTDVLPYEGVDRVVDATAMPFEDESVRAFWMLNVFHHIPDVEAFFREAERCLVPGGRIIMVDQHVGMMSRWIYRHLHDEPFEPTSREWTFDSTGPLSGANGALAWMVFVRDLARFEREFKGLRLLSYEPHTPLRYWLAGGLKRWSLLPSWAFGPATFLDRIIGIGPLCSFVRVQVEKKR